MNEDKDFLGKEPVGKLLLKLALPTVTAQIINMLYNIVDRIYIGHIPEIGEAALTGVGVCMPLIMIVTAFSAFAAYGGAPRASIYMGQGDHDSAEKTLGNCFAVQFIISVLLTAALLLWNRDFLMAFGASDKTIGYGVEYMNIYAIGTIFVQMTLGMNAFITAQGFAKTGMFSAPWPTSCSTPSSSSASTWALRARPGPPSFRRPCPAPGCCCSCAERKHTSGCASNTCA